MIAAVPAFLDKLACYRPRFLWFVGRYNMLIVHTSVMHINHIASSSGGFHVRPSQNESYFTPSGSVVGMVPRE